jgi:tyrosinase
MAGHLGHIAHLPRAEDVQGTAQRYADQVLTERDVQRLMPTDPSEQGLRIRRNEADLTEGEREAFLRAFRELHRTAGPGGKSRFSEFVNIHGNPLHNMHSLSHHPVAGVQRFLPWHRVYLLKFEDALRAIEPTVTLPYWEWSGRGRHLPPWLEKEMPTGVDLGGFAPYEVTAALPAGRRAVESWTGSRKHDVTRNPGHPNNLPTRSDIAARLQRDRYTTFTLAIEGAYPGGAHNAVHGWVGGSMSAVPTAPADPLFWLHHAEIDRLWAIWQAAHPREHPTLVGLDAVVDPWPETHWQAATTRGLGYAYAEEMYP